MSDQYTEKFFAQQRATPWGHPLGSTLLDDTYGDARRAGELAGYQFFTVEKVFVRV